MDQATNKKRILNYGMLWAFSHEAKHALLVLTLSGVDFDLAVAVLERMWNEERIYDIGDRAKATRSD